MSNKDMAKLLVEHFLSQYSEEQLIDLLSKQLEQKISEPKTGIPVEIFSKNLTPFESLVKFLKENKKHKYSEIGKLLSRDQRTIWSTYNRAQKKLKDTFSSESDFLIPLEIFDSKKSIFESLVIFLHDSQNQKFSEIAKILNKDPRTIWTTYNRGKKK